MKLLDGQSSQCHFTEWPRFLRVLKDSVGWASLLFCCVLELQWINSRTVVLLDSAEKLHVIDRQTQEELETVEISEVQLVYNSSHFKSLATGGNVSQALVRVTYYLSTDLINVVLCCCLVLEIETLRSYLYVLRCFFKSH